MKKYLIPQLTVLFFLLSIGKPSLAQWKTVKHDTPGNFTFARFFNGKGFAVHEKAFGQARLYTSLDTGATWTITDSTYLTQRQYYFSDANNGFMTAADFTQTTLYKSINGGSTWTPIFSLNSGTENYNFADGKNQFIVVTGGNGTSHSILFSNDNGATWDSTTAPIPQTIRCLDVVTDSVAFIGGSNKMLLWTIDAGTTWDSSYSSVTGDIYSLHFSDPMNGWIATRSGGQTRIYMTANQGMMWNEIAIMSGNVNRIFFKSATEGFLLGESIFKKSIDAGISWNDVSYVNESGITLTGMMKFYDMDMLDTIGIIACEKRILSNQVADTSTTIGLGRVSDNSSNLNCYFENGRWNITSGEQGILEVMDILGRFIYKEVLSGDASGLALINVPKGIYVLRFTGLKTSKVIRLVVP